MFFFRKIKFLIVLVCLLNSAQFAWATNNDIAELQQRVLKACPKQWEDLHSDIELNPNVLDIWQGDLSDKAQFVQYANTFLVDENGQLLIDSYSDIVTIMTECGAQRVALYKQDRKKIVNAINGLVSQLEGQSSFRPGNIGNGVDYDGWALEPKEGESELELINLAIGRPTTQTGTSSDELSDTETERSEEEYEKLSEYQGYAVKAVDNNTDGEYSNKSVTHTGFQDQPYWEVDLEQVNKLSSITIYNRTDCCKKRLDGFTLLVSERPIDARKLEDAIAIEWVDNVGVFSLGGSSDIGQGSFQASSDAELITYASAGQNAIQINFSELISARYIRIQLAGQNTVLSLAEVVVMGYETAPAL